MPRPDAPAAGAAADGKAPELALLRGIMDAAPARVAVVGRDFRYRYVNREFCEFARKAPEQIIGLTTRELVGEDVARQLDPFAYAALGGQTVVREGWIDYRLNGRKYINWLFAPMRAAPGGEVDGFIVMMRDQTELRQREEELARRGAMLEALLDSLADAVAISDAEERLVMCNSGFRRLFECPEDFAGPGTSLVELARHRLARGLLYPHESAEDTPERLVERQARRVAEAGGRLVEQIRLRDRWLDLRRRSLPQGGGVTTYMDVTDRVEAETARRAQREALREAQQLGAAASLLAGVAHELNNPLSVVAAQATLLEEEAAGTPLADRAGKVSAAARRCGRIVASLLASAQRRAPRREPVALRAVVDSAVDLMSLRLRAAGVELALRLPRRPPRLSGDADQLVHLLANLLGNAVQALRDRPPPRRLRLEACLSADTGEVALRVADNGPGVPPGLRERIFDPFFTTRAGGGGTGIGLALCRTIVQDHGGRIEVEETPGGGATFVVRLPAAEPARRAPKGAGGATRGGGGGEPRAA
jgi:two-component system NtrC family sensor kinase